MSEKINSLWSSTILGVLSRPHFRQLRFHQKWLVGQFVWRAWDYDHYWDNAAITLVISWYICSWQCYSGFNVFPFSLLNNALQCHRQSLQFSSLWLCKLLIFMNSNIATKSCCIWFKFFIKWTNFWTLDSCGLPHIVTGFVCNSDHT